MSDLTKAMNKLNRCLYLLENYQKPPIGCVRVDTFISFGTHGGIPFSSSSYDFDIELNDHLLPYLKVILDLKAKHLKEEIRQLLELEINHENPVS